ncbi:MAG TPA: 50S ribosomal protein L11 methyltransferase, partial [Thermoanaerobaculia bacterium]|nr:50S ribosomal protein L11 methyltransferase [Thermoanaerobaculia bacterium]
MRTYQRAIYHLPAVLEDEFAAELFAAGTLGCEARPAGTSLTLAAWFHDQPPAPSPVWIRLGVRLAGVEPVPEQDWLAEYRSGVQPFPLGHHFWIDPGEPDQPAASPPEGRWLLRLPARTAFGVGSHES